MKKSVIWITALTLISVMVFAGLTVNKKQSNESVLYPVQVDGKWGYINKEGKLVIEPQYAMADDFYNGVAVVQIKMDSDNNEDAEGMNSVKYGAINTDGKMVVKPEFSFITKFNEGVAGAIIVDNDTYDMSYFIVDKKGKILYALPSDMEIVSMVIPAGNMPTQSEGLILVRNANTEIYGFIDRYGKWIIPCRYNEGYNFSDGLALVKDGADYKYINKVGKTIIDAGKYKFCGTFSEGLAAVAVQADEKSAPQYGYIDTKGNIKITPQFTKAYRFSEGLAKVCKGEGINQYVIGYIDGSGAYKIEPDVNDNADETLFSEGLAPVNEGAGGYRNEEGKLMINPVVTKDEDNFLKHNTAGAFGGGIAKVSLSNGEIGYIGITGKYIWEPSK